jgi:hypothetical protein
LAACGVVVGVDRGRREEAGRCNEVGQELHHHAALVGPEEAAHSLPVVLLTIAR